MSGACAVSACSATVLKRGMCSKHYQRWWKHGDPTKTLKAAHGEQLEFLRRCVSARSRKSCWSWPYRQRKGYGLVYDPRTKRDVKVHRFAFELEHGHAPLAEGCHTCDQPLCFNPAHIFDGTHLDNMRDAQAKGRLRPPPVTYGADHPRGMARLSPDEVLLIRSDARPYIDIARDYSVSRTTVSQIKTRKRWSWLP